MKSSSNQRIRGIDLARALALLGMMAAHFGAHQGVHGNFLEMLGGVTHGRSAILFATLAGVSIAIMTGRTEQLEPEKVVPARTKLVLRALIILTIGSALQMYGSGIDIILPTYALLFVVAIPFIRASRKTLILWSAAFAVIGSALYFAWQPFMYSTVVPVPFQSVLANSNYAPIPWVAIVLAGMAIGRTDLTKVRNIVTIGGIGAALALVGYTVSYMATPNEAIAEASQYSKDGSTPAIDSAAAADTSGVDDQPPATDSTPTDDYSDPYANEHELNEYFTPATEATENTFMVNGNLASDIDISSLDCTDIGYEFSGAVDRYFSCYDPTQQADADGFYGDYSEDSDENLSFGDTVSRAFEQITQSFETYLIAGEHTGSATEIIASIGVSMLVIAACILVCLKFSAVFYPLIALGSMPLTIYTAHVLTFKHILPDFAGFAWLEWTVSVVIGAAFAMAWKRFFKRGPLESVMAWIIGKFMTTPQPKPARYTSAGPDDAGRADPKSTLPEPE